MEKFSSVQGQARRGKQPGRLISLLSYLTSKKKGFLRSGHLICDVFWFFFLPFSHPFDISVWDGKCAVAVKVEHFKFKTANVWAPSLKTCIVLLSCSHYITSLFNITSFWRVLCCLMAFKNVKIGSHGWTDGKQSNCTFVRLEHKRLSEKWRLTVDPVLCQPGTVSISFQVSMIV